MIKVSMNIQVGDVFVSNAGTVREVEGYDDEEIRIRMTTSYGMTRRTELSIEYVTSAVTDGSWGHHYRGGQLIKVETSIAL